jgi:uncharacterized protein (TIGR03067 family)
VNTILMISAIVLLYPGTDEPKNEAVKQEYARFDGTWKFESVEFEGKTMPIQNFSGMTLVLKGDRWTLVQGSQKASGTYTVDPDKKPKQLDTVWTEGMEKGQKQLGIYELTDDTYKVCMGMPGKPRPTEFVSKPGSGHFLEVLKRVKPKRQPSQ